MANYSHEELWQKCYLTTQFFVPTISLKLPIEDEQTCFFSYCYQEDAYKSQWLSASWSRESVVAAEGWATQPTESNYCGLLGILPGVTAWCMTGLNDLQAHPWLRHTHRNRFRAALDGLTLSCWQFGSPAPLPDVSWTTFGMSASLPGLTFPSQKHTPLKQAVCGRLRGRGRGSIWDEWDTFMEYCMLNNRLREGVMSLSRKHKHYVLIRRLIINKVQGRCSETKLFSLVFIRTKSSFNRATEKHSAAIINRHYHFYWLLGNSFALLTCICIKGTGSSFHIYSKKYKPGQD